MGVPHVSYFCGCMSLQIGAKCIGFLHLISSVILLIFGCMMVSIGKEYMDSGESWDTTDNNWFLFFIGVTLVAIVHMVLAITLLVSTFKRNMTGLRVWVGVMCPLCLASCLGLLVLCVTNEITVFVPLLVFGILSYFIICVYNYYLMLKNA